MGVGNAPLLLFSAVCNAAALLLPALRVHQLPDLGLVLKRGLVLSAGRLHESLDLGAKLPAHLRDALGQALHPRILGLEGLAELPVSRLELGRLLLEVADQWIL